MLIVLLGACNIAKKLPPGTYLYKGAAYNIVKDSGDKSNIRSVKKQLKKALVK